MELVSYHIFTGQVFLRIKSTDKVHTISGQRFISLTSFLLTSLIVLLYVLHGE
jgi:hypothetical protein